MSKTESLMIPLGTPATPFTLLDVISNKTVSFPSTLTVQATVLLFICNHCPYVKLINAKLVELASVYQLKKVKFIAINSNDPETYPDDSPDNMRKVAKTEGYTFPYLFDDSQSVAKLYQAVCTPDIFVYDKSNRLVYRGQFDGARPGNNISVTGADLQQALDCILNNTAITDLQKPSIGCNIKWKK